MSRPVIVRVVASVVAAAACATPWTALAVPGGLALLLLPGASILELVGDRSARWRSPWTALAAALVLVPLPLAALWRFSNDRWAVLALLLLVNVALALLAARRPAQRPAGSSPPVDPAPAIPPAHAAPGQTALAGLCAAVFALVLATLWLPRAFDRTATQGAHDYIKHHALLLSLELHPLPLRNVFYAGEPRTPYYYYEYHYYVAAALRKLTRDRISIALAFGLVAGLMAAATVGLVARLGEELSGTWQVGLLAGACASVVGGWDALAAGVRMLATREPVIILDSWCPTPWRAHNLLTQYVWCPQHIAAAAGLLLAALWLRAAPRSWRWVIVAPLLGAAIFGSSAYLAMLFFPAAGAYVLMRLWSIRGDAGRLRSEAAVLGVCALAGLILMLPQALGYADMARRFPGGLTTDWPRFDYAVLGRIAPPGPLANYLDAWWILLIDFGVLGVGLALAGRALWARLWNDDGARLLLLAGVIGTVAMFTFRSSVNPFDYGFRIGVKPLQFLGAVCAAALIWRTWLARHRRPAPAILVGIAVALGLPIGLYEAPLAALRSLLLKESAEPDLVRFVRRELPRDAVLQGDPVARVTLPQVTDRRAGVLDPDNSHTRVFFPLDEQKLRSTFSGVQAAFSVDDSTRAQALFLSAGVTHVFAGLAERERYGELRALEDGGRFERLYASPNGAVYAVRQPAP